MDNPPSPPQDAVARWSNLPPDVRNEHAHAKRRIGVPASLEEGRQPPCLNLIERFDQAAAAKQDMHVDMNLN